MLGAKQTGVYFQFTGKVVMRSPRKKERRSQVVQMCEEVASRVERAARRLRPPAWFRAAATSPRGFLLAARRPSRLPPWPLPEIQHQQQTTDGGEHSHSGSRSAPATLTRRRDRRDRQRGSDAADEETWSRDAATLYATPLSSRRQRPESDWSPAPLGGWDSTPPRRHRSQLTLRTASPAASSDAGWSQEVRRPYLGWRSLERLSRRPWTPEERLAASLLERSGRATPTSAKEANAPKKQSAGTQHHQPSGGASTPSLRKESAPKASRETTAASTLLEESVTTPTSPVTSTRTEHMTHSHKQVKQPSPLSRHVTVLSIPANQRNHDAETPSSSGRKSTKIDDLSTGSLVPRPAEEDSSLERHTENENSKYFEEDSLSNVSSYSEVQGQKNPQHSGLILSTQIQTLPVRRTDRDVDLSHTSHKDQSTNTQYFSPAERDPLEKTLHREKSPEKVTDRSSRHTVEEKAIKMQHQYLNGPTQLPTQLKALSVTTRYSNGEMPAKANKDFPAGDLLARSYDTAPLHASNTISAPTTSSADDSYRTTNHLNSTLSPSTHGVTFTTVQSPVSDSGDIRAKQVPTVELRTRSLEVTLPQRVTTSDTSRKLSIQEQFWVAEDRPASEIQDDPSLLILPQVKQTVTAAHRSVTSSSTANRKSAPTFLTTYTIGGSPDAATDNKTLPYPVQFDYTSESTYPSANDTKTFDISNMRSVELCTRSVEIPLPQVTSVIAEAPGPKFPPSDDTENPSVPNIKEDSPKTSAAIRAVSMPPVPRDRTFCIESPTVLHKGSSTFSPLPAVEFQSTPSDVTLLQKTSTVATSKPNSHRHETEAIASGLSHRHSLPASPLVETSLTTIHVTSTPEVVEYQSVYSDSSPLLGRKPFTIKHVETPGGHRTKISAENTKSREISLSPALPKPFEPMPIPHSKIPVPTTSRAFSEKEIAATLQTETSHKPVNHIRPSERMQKSSLPVTSVIRRPSYRVATRNELNPSSRNKRSAAGVNFADVVASTSVATPAEKSRTMTAPIAKPPRFRVKNNATSTPKPPPRQKPTTSPTATVRTDNAGPVPHNTELHLSNGVSPLPYSALRILDSQLPQNTTGTVNSMSVSFKFPVSSEADTTTTKGTVSKQSIPPLEHVPNPTLLTPLKYKPCTTTDL